MLDCLLQRNHCDITRHLISLTNWISDRAIIEPTFGQRYEMNRVGDGGETKVNERAIELELKK